MMTAARVKRFVGQCAGPQPAELSAMAPSPSLLRPGAVHASQRSRQFVVVAMLERFADLRSPGGCLRALTAKAAAGDF